MGWWEVVKGDQAHKRKERGQMKTFEGRRTIDHEDFVHRLVVRNWVTVLEGARDCDDWMKTMRPIIDKYFVKAGFPKDPRYVKLVEKQAKWREAKEKERQEEQEKEKKKGEEKQANDGKTDGDKKEAQEGEKQDEEKQGEREKQGGTLCKGDCNTRKRKREEDEGRHSREEKGEKKKEKGQGGEEGAERKEREEETEVGAKGTWRSSEPGGGSHVVVLESLSTIPALLPSQAAMRSHNNRP